MITLTIPNDDHIALRAFGKALEEMALAHGAEPRNTTVGEMSYKLHIDTSEATAALERLRTTAEELQPEVDTTAQQVESLAVPGATHIITDQKLVGDPEPVGDGNFSQGYVATVEEIADPVDSTGTPWDERIHSASKALNADGTWRLRRKPKDMDETEWAAFVESVKGELQYQTEQQPINLNHVSIDPAHDEGVNDIEPTSEEIDEWEKSKQPDYLPEPPVPVTPSGEELCIDEGCDHHGTPHICITPEPPVTPPGDDFHTDAGVVTEQTIAAIPPIPVPPPVVVPPAPYTIPVTAEVVNDWDFPKLMTFLTERHGKIDVATVNTLLAGDGLSSIQELNAHPDKIGPFVARVKAHLGE